MQSVEPTLVPCPECIALNIKLIKSIWFSYNFSRMPNLISYLFPTKPWEWPEKEHRYNPAVLQNPSTLEEIKNCVRKSSSDFTYLEYCLGMPEVSLLLSLESLPTAPSHRMDLRRIIKAANSRQSDVWITAPVGSAGGVFPREG